jgi:hypothetical protein
VLRCILIPVKHTTGCQSIFLVRFGPWKRLSTTEIRPPCKRAGQKLVQFFETHAYALVPILQRLSALDVVYESVHVANNGGFSAKRFISFEQAVKGGYLS